MANSKLLVPVLAASLLLVPITARAASICKGIPDQAKCEALEVYTGIKACTWMKERQRADGGSTKSHCRGSGKSVSADATKINNPAKPTN